MRGFRAATSGHRQGVSAARRPLVSSSTDGTRLSAAPARRNFAQANFHPVAEHVKDRLKPVSAIDHSAAVAAPHGSGSGRENRGLPSVFAETKKRTGESPERFTHQDNAVVSG